MKQVIFILTFVLSLSATAQRYRFARIIFKDSTSVTGYINNFLKSNNQKFDPEKYKKRIPFKKNKKSHREFLDVKKIDRIILFDDSMNVDAIFDFVDIKEFNYFKKNLPLAKKVKIKLLPLLFETEKYRVYRYEFWENNRHSDTYYYIRRKNQKYAYHFWTGSYVPVFGSSYPVRILLYQVRAMQEFGKDCPSFLEYLKPLYQKYHPNTNTRAERKKIAQQFKKLKKSSKSKKEFEIKMLMSYLKKFDELCK